MPKRLSDSALALLAVAEKEAKRLRHNYFGTEHILLALLVVDDTIPKSVLRAAGVKRKKVIYEIETIVGRGTYRAKKRSLPLTPRAMQLVDLSLRQAEQLGHGYIGPEHFLLALVVQAGRRDGNEGVAAMVLRSLDVDLERLRTDVIECLALTYLSLAEPGELREAAVYVVGRMPESLRALRRDKGADHPDYKLGQARFYEGIARRLRKEAKELQDQPVTG